jgi:hypothetical protein
MKITQTLGGVLLMALLALTGCKSSHVATTPSAATMEETRFVTEVLSHTPTAEVLSAKVKFTLNAKGNTLSVGGNLRMKKDDVIQLSFVALGIIEGGRVEFTKDEALIIDRIHKQYARIPYAQLSMLKQAEVDFYTLQALFWNELTHPGYSHLTAADASLFTLKTQGSEWELESKEYNGLLTYKFYASASDGTLTKTTISHTPYVLNWNYQDFVSFQQSTFPSTIQISVEGLSQPASMNLRLSNLSTSSDWETRTTVSSRYKQVTEEEIMERLLKLQQ